MSLWQGIATYLLALPFFVAMLHSIGRVILSRMGIGNSPPPTTRRLAVEWACLLAAAYVYTSVALIIGHH